MAGVQIFGAIRGFMNSFRWNSKFLSICILLLCTLCLSGFAEASEQNADINLKQLTSLCPVVQTSNGQNQPVYFLQHAFEDGTQDLAITIPAISSEFKRVTFGESIASQCNYKALAVAPGGDWGWHLAWLALGSNVLSYARMDGEAWVTSPTKKLSKNAQLTRQPDIFTWEQQVWIVWQELGEHENNLYAVYSADEGRSWQDAKLIAKIAGNLGNLQLIAKQNKPYLIWNGATEAVPLLSW